MLVDDLNPPCYSDIVFVLPDDRGARGRMYISNFRMYFVSDAASGGGGGSEPSTPLIIDLPLGLISRIEKVGHQTTRSDQAGKSGSFYGFLITCKVCL